MAQTLTPESRDIETGVEQLADLHDLDVKALTTPMHALPEGPGVWLVMHAHEHYVSFVCGEFHCDCKGYLYGHECYHIRRLKYELGVKQVPPQVNQEAMCDQFREWTGPEDITAEMRDSLHTLEVSAAGVDQQTVEG